MIFTKLPKELIHEDIWAERFEYIRAFERYMYQNGTNVLKFFLYLSLEEQKKRFISRMKNPEKNWKFDPNDLYERSFWGEYMQAYEEAIQSTACQDSPWYIIPADDKPYSRVVIADAVCQHLDSLNIDYPTLSEEVQSNLQGYIQQLQNE